MTKDQILRQIDSIIDGWVNDTISSLTSGKSEVQPRGIWDRLKGTFYNLRYGRNDKQNNPYYWKNRFGDELGTKQECHNPSSLTLSEYCVLKSTVNEAQTIINEALDPETEKLRLVQLIRKAAEDLKGRLRSVLSAWDMTQASSGSGMEKATADRNVGGASAGNKKDPEPVPSSDVDNSHAGEEAKTAAVTGGAETAPVSGGVETEPVTGGTETAQSAAKSSGGKLPTVSAADGGNAVGTNKGKKTETDLKKSIREAAKTRKESPSNLTPQVSWLNSGGRLVKEKMPWVIAWISTMPHASYDDEIIERELKNKDRVGDKFASKFKGLAWKKEGHRSLIRGLRQHLGLISDEDFKKIIHDLTGGDTVDAEISRSKQEVKPGAEKKTKQKEDPKQSAVSSRGGEKEQDQDSPKKDEEKKKDLLKTLYEGKTTKEILDGIKSRLLSPSWIFLGKDESIGRKFNTLMGKLRAQYGGDDDKTPNAQEESKNGLIIKIASGDLLKDILQTVGSGKLKESDLIGFLG